jgi:hypothetical protein
MIRVKNVMHLSEKCNIIANYLLSEWLRIKSTQTNPLMGAFPKSRTFQNIKALFLSPDRGGIFAGWGVSPSI